MANINITQCFDFDEGLQIIKDVATLRGISASLRDKGDEATADILDSIVIDFNASLVRNICNNVNLIANSIEDS